MVTKYLGGFDYATFLKRRFMVGQVDPWRRTDDDKPLFTTLVSVDVAIAECSEWSGQDIDRTRFVNYLKLNDIIPFRNVDEFVALREQREETRKQVKLEKKARRARKLITDEQRKVLSERMAQINETRKASISEKSQ